MTIAELNSNTTMTIWFARDKKGALWGYLGEPIRSANVFAAQEGDGIFSVRDDFFPEITWENSPVKFSLTKEEE